MKPELVDTTVKRKEREKQKNLDFEDSEISQELPEEDVQLLETFHGSKEDETIQNLDREVKRDIFLKNSKLTLIIRRISQKNLNQASINKYIKHFTYMTLEIILMNQLSFFKVTKTMALTTFKRIIQNKSAVII
jgi:translation initiation factor 2 beta subunit (eIF-2beta)/eIF-5